LRFVAFFAESFATTKPRDIARRAKPHSSDSTIKSLLLELDTRFARSDDGRRSREMTHVVAQPCFGCKYTDCVVVCPVECFYEGEQMLYIHPDECIDCEACVPECPVEAIFHEDNLPEDQKPFTALNAEMASQCPVITEKKEPMC
jgi:ferredoxin